MRNMENALVEVIIKDEIEVAELVEVMDKLFATTTHRHVTSQETVITLLQHVSIANHLIM